MIWQAWVTLVLIGTGWSYVAFVEKRASTWAGLATFGFYAVAAIGALDLQTQFATDGELEIGAAILCTVAAMAGLIVFVASVAGQYGTDDDTSPGAGEVRRHMEAET